MDDEKLYRIKTKKGAHINEKRKKNGARAAIQFDADNNLLGPVDLVEVDKSEYTKKEYVEVEKKDRGLKQVILEDAVAPAIEDALSKLVVKAVESGVEALSEWTAKKVIPAAKKKGSEVAIKARSVGHEAKEKFMAKTKTQKRSTKQSLQKKAEINTRQEEPKVVHTRGEVDQIVNNMRLAALYIAAGIRELSNTVIEDDGTDPEKLIAAQNKLKELSSEDVQRTIDFMLEDKNRDMLDKATVQMFEAFRQKDILVEGKAVPISRYLSMEA